MMLAGRTGWFPVGGMRSLDCFGLSDAQIDAISLAGWSDLAAGNLEEARSSFQTVVEQYQTTTHVPEALHRLTESYLALGMTDEAQASAAVLGYNFPGSAWYERSYALLQRQDLEPKKSEGSWLSRLF